MTKAASVSIGLAVLLATTATTWAQTAPTDTAIQEAVRRQADTITLRQKLVEARAAEARKDLEGAARLYDSAYELSQKIGSGITNEAAQTIAGLASVRITLAQAAQSKKDYKEADAQISRVIKVDPKNIAALQFKKANDAIIDSLVGKIPSPAAQERATEIKKEQVTASTLVQDGKLLYEMGKIDEAEAKLKQALAIDPGNRAAFQYLTLVKESRLSRADLAHEQTTKKGFVEVAQAWETPLKREQLPIPNPYATSDLVHTGKGRQTILSKLNRITMDSVFYDGLPLGEVVRNLSEEAKKRDPDKKGVNFIINPNSDSARTAGATTTDPVTGLPIAAGPAEAVDVSGISVKINPPLSDVRLADVLDAIIKVADTPIKYSVEDYAVIFSLKGQEAAPLYTRIFKVDPNTFYQGLESVGAVSFGDIQTSTGGGGGSGGGGGGGGGGGSGGQGGQGGNQNGALIPRVSVSGVTGGQGGQGGGGGQTTTGAGIGAAAPGAAGAGAGGTGLRFVTRSISVDEVQSAVRSFFTAAGVDLTPPKNVFFNDRQGTLLVRATLQDLDIIESAVQALNIAPPMINIKSRFAQIIVNDAKALGLDWYLGNITMNDNKILTSGGSQPSFNTPPNPPANAEGTFPGSGFFGTAIPASANDGLITGGLRDFTSTPALASITGILTDPQFRVVLKALQQHDGTDILVAPEVTTLSGRQAQIQVVDILTIVTGTTADQTANGATTTGTGGNVVQNTGTTIQPDTQALPFGPTLDVIPYVSADGCTIQMTIIPTVTEFLGYDDPGQFVVSATTAQGATTTAVLPLPHFRVRQVTTSCTVWDGQTVVLGGLIAESVQKLKDQVPLLGDIPFLGKLFRSESTTTKKANLVIFVTPTIVDPAGNRVHLDDEMPFARTAVSPQAPVANQ